MNSIKIRPLLQTIIITVFLSLSCSKDDIKKETIDPTLSTLEDLVLTIDGVDYSTRDDGLFALKLENKIPYDSRHSQATVKSIEVSEGATSSLKVGDSFQLDIEADGYEFRVNAANGTNWTGYTVRYEVDFPEFQVTPVPVTPQVTQAPKPVITTFLNSMQTDEFYAESSSSSRGPWEYWVGPSNGNSITTGADGYKETQFHQTPQIDVYDAGDPAYLEYAALMMKLSGINVVNLTAPVGIDGYEDSYTLEHTYLAKEAFKKVGIKYFINLEVNTLSIGFEPLPEDEQKERNETLYKLYNENYFSDENYFKEDGLPYLYYIGLHEFVDLDLLYNAYKSRVKFMVMQVVGETAERNKEIASAVRYLPIFDNGEPLYPNSLARKNEVCGPGIKCFSQIFPSKEFFLANPGDASYIPFDDGQFFNKMFDLSNQLESDFYFIDSWNDYRVGNTIEPSVSYGYKPLEIVQQFTGSSNTVSELELVTEMYLKRKAFAKDSYAQGKLDQVFEYLNGSKFDEARTMLESIE